MEIKVTHEDSDAHLSTFAYLTDFLGSYRDTFNLKSSQLKRLLAM